MKFQVQKHILKSKKEVTVRLPEDDDARALIDLKIAYIKNTSTLPWTVAEYPNDIENELKIIESYRSSSNSILLLAEYEGELIGNIDISDSKRIKMAHTAVLGMGIKENWRNQGLGKALIISAIDWARNNAKLEIIWLDVYASNELGYNLYKNMGFEVSGIIKDFFIEGSSRIDKIQMYLRVK